MNLKSVAQYLNGECIGDHNLVISGFKSLKSAKVGDLSLFVDHKYVNAVRLSEASAFIVHKKVDFLKHQIIVNNPRKALADAIKLFYASRLTGDIQFENFRDSVSSKNNHISVDSYIGKGTDIGEGSIVYPKAYIGENCKIGKNCIIYPNVTILDGSILGDRVLVSSGVVIGTDGFSHYKEDGQFTSVPHVGGVVIEDDVEIGANTTVDGGCLDPTIIKKGSKIDNLVQIAHNCQLGQHCLIAAQVGFTGSVTLGNYVTMGGQSAVSAVQVADHVTICARSGVTKSIDEASQIVSGFPAWDHADDLKCTASQRKGFKKSKIKKV